MSDDPTFFPHSVGLEYERGLYRLTVVWVEYKRSPHRNYYWVSIFEQEAGDIWGANFKTLDEAKASFEQRKRELDQGIIPEMPRGKGDAS